MTGHVEKTLQRETWARKGRGPLYLQLRDHIAEVIRSGQLLPGDALPSERDLAEFSGMSRITVRKAVQDLAREGLVVQRQGSGTSVSPSLNRVEQSLTRLTSFSEDMALRGKKVRSQWLDRGLFTPTVNETVALGLKPHSLVARISRLRIADDRPLAIERAAMSPDYLPDPEKIGHSLYAHLDSRGFKPVRAIQRITAINLAAEDAELLEMEPGYAGLSIERISYLDTGQVVEFTQSKYRGDAYEFVAELEIPKAAK
ncbi:MAG: GntR family transcriptional regulator [Hoeflea sp.]|uniref:GntR family transcriptional regulator n=1 Tax=Hoeflea sp. TaxID=1940281 RepID=UPI003EF77233